MWYKITLKEKGKKKGDVFSIFIKAKTMEKALHKASKELSPYEKKTYQVIQCKRIKDEKGEKKTMEERLFFEAVKERNKLVKMRANAYDRQAIRKQQQRYLALYAAIKKADLICEYHHYQTELL